MRYQMKAFCENINKNKTKMHFQVIKNYQIIKNSKVQEMY